MKKLVSFIIVTGILMSLTGCGKGKADAVSAQSVRVEDIKNNVSGIEDIVNLQAILRIASLIGIHQQCIL